MGAIVRTREGVTAMRKSAFLAGLQALLLAGAVWAQEPEETKDEEVREPRHSIRVLQNPYDIASFYRSSQSRPGVIFSSPYGFMYNDRYAIASFYRQGAQGRYSRFWQSGYGYRRPGPFFAYRGTIGENGDLCLFAPTILAPVGPLTSVFFDGR